MKVRRVRTNNPNPGNVVNSWLNLFTALDAMPPGTTGNPIAGFNVQFDVDDTENPSNYIQDYTVSGGGLIAYTARFREGVGDATNTNNQGLFSTDTALGIPVLRVRKDDVYTIAPFDRKTTEITLSGSANPRGGTGGYGRVINDAGEVAFRSSMNFNSSGMFVLVS